MTGQDAGRLAPPGTQLFTQNCWFDGLVEMRGGSTFQTDANSSVNLNGTVSLGGSTSLGAAPINDLTEVISPSSYGLIAFNYPYLFATGTGSAAVTGGSLYLAKLPLAGGTVVTNIWVSIATAASGLTTGQNFAGLYNASGALVASTGDLTSTIGTNTGTIQGALSAPYTVPAGGGNYYIGLVFNAGTTEPVLTCYTGQVTVTTSVANFGSATKFGNTAAKYPFAVSATTGNTALPASITMSSNTATGAYTFWVGVN